MKSCRAEPMVRFGRSCFGLGLAGIGIQHWVIGNLVNVVSPTRLESSLGPAVVGAALTLAGVLMAANRALRPAGLGVGVFFVAMVAVAHLPDVLAQLRRAPAGTPWWQLLYVGTTPLKAVVLAGGAGLIASLPLGESSRLATGLRRGGAYTLGLFLLYGGAEHFIYLDFVASLIGAWLPGHVFWTGLAGVALIAGGLGLLTGTYASLAAGLSGLMIFLWVFLIHLPRAVADPISLHGNECTSGCEALAFSGLGFVLWRVLPRARPR